MIPVTLFNANPLSVTIGINSPAKPLWLGGTNASLEWEPQVLANTVQLNPSGSAAPNVLAIGNNSAVITPYGALTPFQITLNVSGAQQWMSVQIYLFFDTTKSVSWILLNAGQLVGGSVAS
jgi:hypothetical protein